MRVILCLAVILLFSCKKNTPALEKLKDCPINSFVFNSDSTALINALYPVKIGNTWHYQKVHYVGTTPMDTSTRTVHITDMGTINSESGFPKEWWVFNHSSNKIINQDKTQYQMVDDPGDECARKLKMTFYYTTSPDPTTFTESTHVTVHSWTYQRTTTTIVTPAGTFTNCLKESIGYEGAFITDYYADGIGLIKETLVYGEHSTVEELQSYSFH